MGRRANTRDVSRVITAGVRHRGGTHLAFQVTDQQAVKNFARFVAVANVFESFGRVLPADIEEDFFTTSVQEIGTIRQRFASSKEMTGA